MQQTTIGGHHTSHYPFGEAVWLLAGIIVLIASGDAFALLTAAVMIVVVIWGLIRAIEHRVRNRAELASVTHLRQRHLNEATSASVSLPGSSAA
jgi:hypothetical protein